jgi:hypothetical protein
MAEHKVGTLGGGNQQEEEGRKERVKGGDENN